MAPVALTTPSASSVSDSIKSTFSSIIPGVASSSIEDTFHPLDPLTSSELNVAVRTIRAHALTTAPTGRLWFKFVTLLEPPKALLVPYLTSPASFPCPPRAAQALLAVKVQDGDKVVVQYYEYEVVLVDDQGLGEVTKCEKMRGDGHAMFDADEMLAGEKAVLEIQEVKDLIQTLQLPKGSEVVADPWCYGCDSPADLPRFMSFMMYFRPPSSPSHETNHYSHPLPFIPTIHTSDYKLFKIDYVPIAGGRSTNTINDLPGGVGSYPWDKLERNEYDHALQVEAGGKIRTGLKPLEVIQREGPSFKVNGWEVEWQKWKFRVGFNFREGVTLHNITYDSRSLFHRLSISDMTVPYADPRGPMHRKQAFDLGDIGAGVCANQLDLGCDCLGHIHYFGAPIVDSKGEVKELKNVVCLHEQDEGLGWKHTNFRTGVGSVVRNRVLVVQMIITVDNYEYIFAYKFDQAANIHLETRATGILSTQNILPGERSPYGNIVSPGVLAANHQHLFSLRIDPAIDGQANSVVMEDSVPMPFDPQNPPKDNVYGVGYEVTKTVIKDAGWADAKPEANRVFKMINPNKLNPISGNPVGYKLVPAPSQMMLAHPASVAALRAEFGGHHIWVTSYRDGELFSGGTYTGQSRGNAGGIKSWVARQDNVENDDLVLWHTFGLTHNPRVEDFPVMPVEIHTISLKPADFFSRNPAIDVPASTQKENKSVLFTGAQEQGCCKV